MDGLEAVEISLADCLKVIDFRIDANTYKKDYIKTEKLLEMKQSATIEQMSSSVQNFGAYSLCNLINFSDSGIPFLMTENIRHNYIDWNIHKYVDSVSHELLYKSHCHRNQVLVTMAGEYLGRVAVYDKDEVCSSNQAIAKVTLKPGISPYIVSTFLNSKHGQNQINRLKTITGQPNINMSLIKSLLCPVFSEYFQLKIEQIIISSHKKQEESKQLYQEAEELLLSELGLLDFVPNDNNIAIKSFSNSFSVSGRLDSEYYQPKYDDLESAFNKFKTIKINQLVVYPVSSGATPKAGGDDYSNANDGVPFIRAVDLQGCVVSIDNLNYIKHEIHDGMLKRTKLRQGDVLFSIAGTVGRCSIFDYDFEANINQAVSILRFNETIVKKIYLVLFFNSIVGNLFVSKYSRQGLQTNLNLNEVGELYVPILDMSTQEQIGAKIKQSFALKEQSKQLLDLAKRAVEVAIEESEHSAFKFIGDNKCQD